jgi:hypothetical protein
MRLLSTLVLLITLSLAGCAPPQEEAELTADEKIEQMNTWLGDLKMELSMEGQYACCLQRGCNECILAHGSCPCYNNLQEGRPVCGECYAGWQKGEGIDNEFTADDVRLDTDHSH